MNIFYLSSDPVQCAQWHVDKHCVKMILESAQLLSTTHRVLDGTPTIEKKYVAGSLPARWRNVKRWSLPEDSRFPKDRDRVVYQATHMNHPSAVWVRDSNENYNWLFRLFTCLMDEFNYRYEKEHVCRKLVPYLWLPPATIAVKPFTQPTPAMPDEYKVIGDSITSYHNYYRGAKARMAAWKKRDIPEWFTK